MANELRLNQCVWVGGPQDGKGFSTQKDLPGKVYAYFGRWEYVYVPILKTNGACVRDHENRFQYVCTGWYDTLSGIKSEHWIDNDEEETL